MGRGKMWPIARISEDTLAESAGAIETLAEGAIYARHSAMTSAAALAKAEPWPEVRPSRPLRRPDHATGPPDGRASCGPKAARVSNQRRSDFSDSDNDVPPRGHELAETDEANPR